MVDLRPILVLSTLLLLLIGGYYVLFARQWESDYADVLSGYSEENCTTIMYDRDRLYGKSTCAWYAIDSCSDGEYRRTLAWNVGCIVVDSEYFEDASIGSKHLYYHFNRRPRVYYNQEQLKLFIETNKRPPTTGWMVEATAMLTDLIIVTSLHMISARYASNDASTEEAS